MRRVRLGAAAVLALLVVIPRARAADLPQVTLNAEHTAGRPLEALTQQAVVRYYASAWRTLAEALNDNNASLLSQDFAGVAEQKLRQLVAAQARAGLRTRYVDHGHQLEAVFYSPEGSSIEVRDTAHLEIQVLDGDKLVHSEQATLHYISLLTPTSVRWKVRLLQAIPGE